MKLLKIYVAAKFEEYQWVLKLQEEIRKDGHTITCDWARHASEHPDYFREKPLGVDRQFIATSELSGVQRCDVLVINPHPAGASAYAETTAALVLGKTVIAVSPTGLLPDDRTFLHHPDIIWVGSSKEAIRLIQELAGQRGF